MWCEEEMSIWSCTRLHGRRSGAWVLLTASRGTEYSFEGEPVLGLSETGSIFTSALIDGITTGDADFDHDGLIYVDDLYHYAFEKMQAINVRAEILLRTLRLIDEEGPLKTIGPQSNLRPGGHDLPRQPERQIESAQFLLCSRDRTPSGQETPSANGLFDNARCPSSTTRPNALHWVIDDDARAVAAAPKNVDGPDRRIPFGFHRDCDAASTVVGIRVPTVQVTVLPKAA